MNELKKGRPKQRQDRPLIFQRVKSRVTRTVAMSAKTAQDFDRYIEWASKMAGAEEDETQILLVDLALGQFFTRDKLFQEVLDEPTDVGTSSPLKTLHATGTGT